jgi:hypothetical protein
MEQPGGVLSGISEENCGGGAGQFIGRSPGGDCCVNSPGINSGRTRSLGA